MERKVVAFLGDFYHQRVPLEQVVQRVLSSIRDVKLETQIPTAQNMEHALEQTPAMIILGAENRINPEDEVVQCWLTDNIDHQLEAYVAKGGSLVILHSALASYPSDSKYRKMIKGEFISHPPEGEVRYFCAEGKCPFSEQGHYDYTVIDEFYVVEVDEAETHVFLYSESETYGKGLAGWYHAYGQGKVICLVPTHHMEGLTHEETLRLYHSAFEWGLA